MNLTKYIQKKLLSKTALNAEQIFSFMNKKHERWYTRRLNKKGFVINKEHRQTFIWKQLNTQVVDEIGNKKLCL